MAQTGSLKPEDCGGIDCTCFDPPGIVKIAEALNRLEACEDAQGDFAEPPAVPIYPPSGGQWNPGWMIFGGFVLGILAATASHR